MTSRKIVWVLCIIMFAHFMSVGLVEAMQQTSEWILFPFMFVWIWFINQIKIEDKCD